MIQSKSITIAHEARYFQLGDINEETRNVWFVLHGYGQLGQYFLKKFEPLENPSTAVIAPQGLNKFYLQGFSGRVGSTWMTKEDRLLDIDNYITYLNSLYESLNIPAGCKLNVLGFSQGSATACRWVYYNQFHINALILWAGVFPPDISIERQDSRLGQFKSYFAYGTKDPFLPTEGLEERLETLKKIDPSYEVVAFDGEHDIDSATLLKLSNLIC